jgi:hypothetical protein
MRIRKESGLDLSGRGGVGTCQEENIPIQTSSSRISQHHKHLKSQRDAPCLQLPHARLPPLARPEELDMVGRGDVIRPIIDLEWIACQWRCSRRRKRRERDVLVVVVRPFLPHADCSGQWKRMTSLAQALTLPKPRPSASPRERHWIESKCNVPVGEGAMRDVKEILIGGKGASVKLR